LWICLPRSGSTELVLRWIYCLLVIHGRFIHSEKSTKLISNLEKVWFLSPILAGTCWISNFLSVAFEYFAHYLEHLIALLLISWNHFVIKRGFAITYCLLVEREREEGGGC
jgi:hypothetical protein